MKHLFSIYQDDQAIPGASLRIENANGTAPTAAQLEMLMDELAGLAKAARAREDAAALEEGKYYWYRRKGGITYVQYCGVDAHGVRVIEVDKLGRPLGNGAVTYHDGYPVANFVYLKGQP